MVVSVWVLWALVIMIFIGQVICVYKKKRKYLREFSVKSYYIRLESYDGVEDTSMLKEKCEDMMNNDDYSVDKLERLKDLSKDYCEELEFKFK